MARRHRRPAASSEDCNLVNLVSLNPTGCSITCTRQVETVVADSADALESLGITETGRLVSDRGVLVTLTLAKEDATVELSRHFTGDLVIAVRPTKP